MFRLACKIWRNVKFKNHIVLTVPPVAAFSLIEGKDLKKTELQDPKQLTHSFLIQQASALAVNAATQLLTQTVLAVVDTAEQYKKSLTNLLSMLEDSRQNSSNQFVQPELEDLIIAARSQANLFKNELIELFSLLEYVEKVAESTAETSYLAGAEFVSTSLGERMHSAKLRIEQAKREIDVLEKELLHIQKDIIVLEKKNLENQKQNF